MAVTDASRAAVAAELVRQYAPGAPADVREVAAELVDKVLRSAGRGAIMQQTQFDSEMATYRDVKGGPKLDQSGGGKLDHPAARWRV